MNMTVNENCIVIVFIAVSDYKMGFSSSFSYGSLDFEPQFQIENALCNALMQSSKRRWVFSRK